MKVIAPKATEGVFKVAGKLEGAAKLGQTLTETMEDSAKLISAGSEVLGAAGAILEVVGTVVQAGIGGDLYAKQADYNNAFQNAVNAAYQPVSVADLKNMMATSSGSQTIFGYLSASMATQGPSSFDDPLLTKSPNMQLSDILHITQNL